MIERLLEILILTPFIVIAVVAGATYLYLRDRYLENRAEKKAIAEWGKEGIILSEKSSYLGYIESENGKPFSIHGEGILILTEKGIRFRRYLQNRFFRIISPVTISIDYTDILGLGLYDDDHEIEGPFPPLYIKFINETGQNDEATWVLKNPEQWVETIKTRLTQNNS